MRLIIILSIMAISCDKNQVLTIPSLSGCGDDYCVPIQQDDTTPIKIDLTPISANLVTNGTFASGSNWVTSGFWTIGSGVATWANSGSSDDLYQELTTELTPGYYLIKFDLVNNPISTALMEIRLGGVLFSGIIFSGVANATAQTFYIYGKIDTLSNNRITINAGFSVSLQIDNVEVYQLSKLGFDIKDCDSDTVYYSQTDDSDVEYFETGTITLTNQSPTPTEGQTGYCIVTFDWGSYDLPDGCYCVCLKDTGLIGLNLIQNGMFVNSDDWIITNTGTEGWTITSGYAQHEPNGTSGNDVLTQTLDTPLSADLCYLLTLDYAFISGVGTPTLSIYYDTADLTDQLLQSDVLVISPSIVTALIENIPITKIKFVANETTLRTFKIDNIFLSVSEDCLACELTTDCISLRDWDNYATSRRMSNILLTGTNTTEAFGFPAGYSFSGRIFGKVRNSKYNDVENVEYKDIDGLVSLQYNENEEVEELQIKEVPKRAHDWIRLALRSQTVTLELEGITKTIVKQGGDYTPLWRKTSDLAPVIVEIKDVQQTPANARNI